jgi:oligoribonuclease
MAVPTPSPSPNRSAANLVWIDLEMTGLDPATDVVLQAALVVTDGELQVLDEAAFDLWQPDEALARMIPLVRAMHQGTGLLDRVRCSTLSLAEVERALLEKVEAWCPYPATLCGNSVWSDRRFIERYMPALHGYLHYRLVDVSTLKVLAQRWYGDAATFAAALPGEHDARVDIQNSIRELRHYRQVLFREVDGRRPAD